MSLSLEHEIAFRWRRRTLASCVRQVCRDKWEYSDTVAMEIAAMKKTFSDILNESSCEKERERLEEASPRHLFQKENAPGERRRRLGAR